MDRTCPKCGFVNDVATGAPMEACPKCGIIYSKAKLSAAPGNSVSVGAPAPEVTAQVVPNQSEVASGSRREKSGAVIGGWVCFGIGLAVMCWSLWLFLIYGPLFLASFIMAIVAIAQKRIANGIAMLLASVLVPLVLSVALFAQRSSDLTKALSANSPQVSSSNQKDTGSSNATPETSSPITAWLLEKGHRDKDFSGSNYIQEGVTFTVRFQNNTDAAIRAFDGTLVFTDLLDNEIKRLKVSISHPIGSKENIDWSGVMEINQFSSEDKHLNNQDAADLKMALLVRKILFADGSTKAY